ncbi:MAG: VCBS repeat-containing protein, partial [Planctomycetales bacterium]|nr:VCBS repeat-containing protein [Planctomycetales bacterium]
LLDVYVGNMFSSAGNRIAFQKRFHTNAADQTRRLFQRHARGNTLFASRSANQFEDITLEAGVNMGRWAWSSNLVDLNNDGMLDIVVANGFVTNDDPHDL